MALADSHLPASSSTKMRTIARWGRSKYLGLMRFGIEDQNELVSIVLKFFLYRVNRDHVINLKVWMQVAKFLEFVCANH